MEENITYYIHNYTIPRKISIIGTTLGSLIICIGIIGNFLVITSIAVNGKLRRRNNVFIASLGVADLIVLSCLCTIYTHTYRTGHWDFNGTICFYTFVLNTGGITLTIFHIITITFYRYMLIVYPKHYRRLTKVWVILLVEFFLYALPFVLVTFSQTDFLLLSEIKMGIHVYFNLKSFFCPALNKIQTSAPVAAIFGIIVLLLVAMYIHIYVVVRRSRKRLESHFADSPETERKKNRNAKRELGIVKIMLAVFVVFTLTYIPWPVVFELQKDHNLPDWVYLLTNLLIWSSSSVNWIIYGLMNREFRLTYRDILLCRFSPCSKNVPKSYSDS